MGTRIAQLFVKMLPAYWMDDLCLSLDESGIPKKGNYRKDGFIEVWGLGDDWLIWVDSDPI